MRVSFNQPYFMPWGGVYARMMESDAMVLLDDTLLSNGFTYVNRNRIKGPDGEVWISVPLRRKGRGRQRIRNLEIDGKAAWAGDFLETLRHFYGKSLYFDVVFDEFHSILSDPDDDFIRMTLDLLHFQRDMLSIDAPLYLQSKLGIESHGIDLLLDLARELDADEVVLPYFARKSVEWELFLDEEISVRFLRFDPLPHPQFWGTFIKRLSTLDLLLCCGPAGRAVIERGICIYEFEP